MAGYHMQIDNFVFGAEVSAALGKVEEDSFPD